MRRFLIGVASFALGGASAAALSVAVLPNGHPAAARADVPQVPR
jgi:hypothetical protein